MSYDGKKLITFWVDEEVYQAFIKKCDGEDKPKSRVLRRLVNNYLADTQTDDFGDETVRSHIEVDLEGEDKSWIRKILKK